MSFIKTLLTEKTIEEILEDFDINPVEALEALVEIGIIDLERFEQYYNEQEDD